MEVHPETSRPSETVIPVPLPTRVGTLPTDYKKMSENRANGPAPPPYGKWIYGIPLLVCAAVLWIAWSQFHHPPEVFQRPETVPDPAVKKRIWWMPDLLKTLPPFADGYRVDKHVEKYNLDSCVINGNFPEVNSAIFCYLHDPEHYKKVNRTISQDLKGHGLCGDQPPLTLVNWNQWKKLIDTNVKRIAIVQEPLERFARTFHRICEQQLECFDCQDNIPCFMRKLLPEHKKLAEGLEGHIRTFLSNHFSPQTWNCHFNREFHKIQAIKLGGNQTEKVDFADNLNAVLDRQGVDKDTQKVIKEEILKLPLQLSKPELKIMDTIRKDTDLWRLFRYLYEHDYTVFGFKM